MNDREMQKYLEIGERNRIALTLVKNWCAHAEVVSEGGVGLLQQVTGLPLAMCRVTCRHERAPGAISMHLADNALDFHDRNCFDCDKRQPVAFPNLTSLLGEREKAQALQKERARERELAHESALEDRARRREAALENASHARRSLLALLDRLDREPSEAAAQELAEAVRAVADTVGEDLQDLIAAVVEAGGPHRVEAGLVSLELTGYAGRRLGRLALRAVVRGEAVEVAADIAGRHLDESHAAEIEAAVPGLLFLAERPRGSVLDRFQSSHPDALLAAHRAAPEVVLAGLKEALSHQSKRLRRAAASAVVTLLNGGASFDVAELAVDLIGSFRLPDDPYQDGPAASTAAWVLSVLFQRSPREVGGLLDLHLDDGDEEVRSGVLRAAMEVFRSRDLHAGRISAGKPDRPMNAGPAQARAFQMILRALAALPGDSRLPRLNEFIRSCDRRLVPWDLAAGSAASLLGIAAMACQQADESTSGSSIIRDPRPKELQDWDYGMRAIVLSGLANALVEYVVWVARNHPDYNVQNNVMELFFETLRPLPPFADHFQSMLVEDLGKLGAGHAQKARVLPEIYSAMTHSSSRVRSAACVAYADLCEGLGAECLPSLMHENFLILLGDPYLVVHKRAVYALQRIDLPHRYRRAAFQQLRVIVRIYAANSSDRYFLIDALTELLVLSAKEEQLLGKVQRYALAIAHSQPAEVAYHFVYKAARYLRTSPGYGDLLLDLPITGEPFDYQSEHLVEELSRLPRAEVSRIAQRIVTVGKEIARRWDLAVIPLLSLLNGHGEWEAAKELASAAVLACGNERSRLPARLRLAIYAKALELESALAVRRPDDVGALIGEIRALEAEVALDEEANRERRDVFPRVRAADSHD